MWIPLIKYLRGMIFDDLLGGLGMRVARSSDPLDFGRVGVTYSLLMVERGHSVIVSRIKYWPVGRRPLWTHPKGGCYVGHRPLSLFVFTKKTSS